MPSIHTLIPDIYAHLQNGGTPIKVDVNVGEKPGKPTLRLSQMGPRCPCALWHSIHKPELAEVLPSYVIMKYSYGHVLEQMVIALAKAAGHSVVGEQDAVYVDGITGHRDCVIDGCLVDVKSASSRSFEKFKDKTLAQSDTFGYLDQLDGYLVGSSSDPLVTVKDRGYLLAIDKTLGHMVLYEHILREPEIRARIANYKAIVELASAPVCECGTKPYGKSGNITLDTRASYNIFKHCCFPHLRTFLYADGPAYLTHVARKPDVTEIDKHGKYIYN